jgi:hypothetical protein
VRPSPANFHAAEISVPRPQARFDAGATCITLSCRLRGRARAWPDRCPILGHLRLQARMSRLDWDSDQGEQPPQFAFCSFSRADTGAARAPTGLNGLHL